MKFTHIRAQASRESGPLFPATLATLRADQLSLLHVKATLTNGLPFVKARTTERFAFGTLLFHFSQMDDVGHERRNL